MDCGGLGVVLVQVLLGGSLDHDRFGRHSPRDNRAVGIGIGVGAGAGAGVGVGVGNAGLGELSLRDCGNSGRIGRRLDRRRVVGSVVNANDRSPGTHGLLRRHGADNGVVAVYRSSHTAAKAGCNALAFLLRHVRPR